MCDEVKVGFFARQGMLAQGEAMLRKDKRKAQQAAAAAQAAPAARPDNLTPKAATMVVVVGGIVLLAAMHTILHALLIGGIVVLAVGGISAGAFLGWQVRRRSVALTDRRAAIALAEAERIALERSRHPAIAGRKVIPGVVVSERRERLPRGR